MNEKTEEKGEPSGASQKTKSDEYAPFTANMDNSFRNPHLVSLTVSVLVMFNFGINYMEWIVSITNEMPRTDLRSYIRFAGVLAGIGVALVVPYYVTNFVVWLFGGKNT